MDRAYRQRHRDLTERARELRQSATIAEGYLWEFLRGRRLSGCKFRRQHPLGPFIADFYCDVLRLVVEVDGAVHAEPSQWERDRARDEAMSIYGFTVMRFMNEEVLQDTGRVVQYLLAYVENASQKRSPSPGSPGEGDGG